jgi:hypothetical protein
VEYAVEMSSGAMIYIPNFIKIISDIRNFTQAYRQHEDHISLLSFYKIRKGGQKN